MTNNLEIPSEVNMEKIECASCGKLNQDPFLKSVDRITNLPGLFTIVKCPNCSLQYLSPRPSKDSIGYYYPDDYQPFTETSVVDKTPKKDPWYSFLKPAFKKIPDLKPGHMLEIGAASGNYLVKMQNLGWKVKGVEFSDYAASNARSLGIDVETGQIEDLYFPAKSFDLIVGWMVIEHLHDPNSFFKNAKSCIKDDGFLVLSTPDCNSISRKIFGEYCYDLHLPAHLYHFTPETITDVLNKNGWEVDKIIWQNNAMTFLNSSKTWARENHKKFLLRFIELVIKSPIFLPIKYFLHFLLGITRQSGRMIVWARPSN